jgi:hypothetical protein
MNYNDPNASHALDHKSVLVGHTKKRVSFAQTPGHPNRDHANIKHKPSTLQVQRVRKSDMLHQ